MVATKQHALYCFDAIIGELDGSVVKDYYGQDE